MGYIWWVSRDTLQSSFTHEKTLKLFSEGAEVSSSTDTSELTRHIDALHQHLKYIYYKFDELEKRINSIESKVY